MAFFCPFNLNNYFDFLICFHSIDATESERLGKFVNDGPKSFTNCTVKAVKVDNVPCLCLYSTSDIAAGSELRLDSLFDFFTLYHSLLKFFRKSIKLFYKIF